MDTRRSKARLIAVCIFLLALTDILFTLRHLKDPWFIELNPLLAWLLNISVDFGVLIKMLMSGVGVVGLLCLSDRALSYYSLWFIFWMHILLTIYHIGLSLYWST